MELISVNIGQERSIQNGKASGKTGIYKLPVTTPVQITFLGIPGDAISDTKNHGGPDQAVYVYGALDYAWWSRKLGQEVTPGTFGDNLTISGLESADLIHRRYLADGGSCFAGQLSPHPLQDPGGAHG